MLFKNNRCFHLFGKTIVMSLYIVESIGIRKEHTWLFVVVSFIRSKNKIDMMNFYRGSVEVDVPLSYFCFEI